MSPASRTRGVSDSDTVSAQPSRKVGDVRVLSIVSCREHLGGSWPARSMAGEAVPAVSSLWQRDLR